MKHLLLILAVLGLAGFARAQDAVFVAHPSVTESAVSGDDVKNILLGTKTKWGSGVIKLVVQTSGPLHDGVIQSHTQRSSDQFDKYWKKQVFTGKGSAPATAKTDAEVIAYVAANPGAFGYIAPDAVTAAVKVLPVQ